MHDLPHVYVVTRANIPPAHQAVQSAHAALCLGRQGHVAQDSQHPSLVLLTVPDEDTLSDVAERLRDAGVAYVDFYEEDMDGELTALATEPLDQSQRKLFRNFTMLGACA